MDPTGRVSSTAFTSALAAVAARVALPAVATLAALPAVATLPALPADGALPAPPVNGAGLTPTAVAATQAAAGVIERGDFRFAYDERGISGLAHPRDPYGATVVPVATVGGGAGRGGDRGGGRGGGRGAGGPGAGTLGLMLSYRLDGSDWTNLELRGGPFRASPAEGKVTYSSGGSDGPLRIVETFETDGRVLDWTIELASASETPVTIGDLAINVPVAGPRGPDPQAIFERGFVRHQFVSGHGSFFFYTRASGAPPFLIVTVHPGTKLEYFSGGGRGGGPVFVHSARAGNDEAVAAGTWRQEHTSLTLAPRGSGDAGVRGSGEAAVRYGFRFRWADSYDEMRQILFEEGLFDVRVVPGMSLPSDLSARFSLHTRADIESIVPEFPDSTRLEYLGEPRPDHHLYEVAFDRLGENLLTIRHDGGRDTYLEFFSTEPLETLIEKRAAFLVDRQQVRDPSKWWDGVFGPYDMRAGVTRTIDDPDIFVGRMVYVLTCDDPGLSKAPFLAAKNVAYPDPREIEALEYYLENFVWGGLQRTGEERPYPYGVYGTPEWYTNRSPERRAAWTDRDLDREHVWRSYDYPHVIMLYFHMYEIARLYPEMSSYLDATGYLERAWGTARAFYTYPYEIYPDYYETYKWGLYNELVVLELIDALEREGYQGQADWLRAEWEKKVKYFVYDDEYPLRSEYAFDRTAFESSHALAKYGATRDMEPDEHLWWDVQQQKWYSHPVVRREDARAFMDRQIAGNLVVRGWLNTSYWQLGADHALSYMAAMGGWGVLDYGLNFADPPFDWLQLGYASFLSSWSLMNTGTPQSDYGFWFPGQQHDGAAGWQFMSAKVGGAWMGSSFPGGVAVPRGPWHYDGEIDLGFGAALRMARTLVVDDPLFGWTAYGGTLLDQGGALESAGLTAEGEALAVVPRDGLRQRFDVVAADPRAPWLRAERLGLELDRDGFAAEQPVRLAKDLGAAVFTVENRTGDAHETELSLRLPYGTAYELTLDGSPVELVPTDDWEYPWRATLRMTGGPSRVELVRTTPE